MTGRVLGGYAVNTEQTRIATVLSAYGIPKHLLRFTAHRVSFTSVAAARVARRNQSEIERSLPGWVVAELPDSRSAGRLVLVRSAVVESDVPAEVEAAVEQWGLAAREVRPGMTIRLADRTRREHVLAEWRRISRIKHDRGYLWFIGADEEVLGRWGPGTRFERQPEQAAPASGISTGRLAALRDDDEDSPGDLRRRNPR